MQRRIQNLDMIRGLAASAVMVAHAAILGPRFISPVVSDLPSLLSHLGATAVWLFFVVSGFVVSRPFIAALLEGTPRPHPKVYGIRRAARIYPLYWACLAVALVSVGWVGAGPIGRFAHVFLLHNLVPGRQQALIPVAWTLTLEILFYATVPVAAWLLYRLNRRRAFPADALCALLLLTWLCAIVFLAAVPFLVGEGTNRLWLRGSYPAMIGMFVPGVLLAVVSAARPDTRCARVWQRMQLRPNAMTVAGVLACALAAGLASVDIRPGDTTRLVVWDLSRHAYGVGYGLLVARAALARTWTFGGFRGFLRLGDISYGVYLIHGTLLIVLLENPSLIPWRSAGILPFSFHVVYLALLTIPLSMLSYRFLEKPLSDRARRVTDAGPATRVPQLKTARSEE